MYNEAFIFLLE